MTEGLRSYNCTIFPDHYVVDNFHNQWIINKLLLYLFIIVGMFLEIDTYVTYSLPQD